MMENSFLKVKELFESLNVEYKAVELDLMGRRPDTRRCRFRISSVSNCLCVENGAAFHDAVADVAKQRPLPIVCVLGEVVGGLDATLAAHDDGRLGALLGTFAQNGPVGDTSRYDYDLVVVGGGSGGLACSKVSHSDGHVQIRRWRRSTGVSLVIETRSAIDRRRNERE